jgi:hypothetical protein
MAQVGQAASQAAMRKPFGGLGPEGAGQPGALDVLPVAQDEQCEQPVALASADAGDQLTVPSHLERAQKAKGQWARSPLWLSHSRITLLEMVL